MVDLSIEIGQPMTRRHDKRSKRRLNAAQDEPILHREEGDLQA